jgi:spermidine synthase
MQLDKMTAFALWGSKMAAVSALLLTMDMMPALLVSSDSGTTTTFRDLQEEEFEIGFTTTLLLKDKPLESFKSKYQVIDVYESAAKAADNTQGYFGKVLVLDGNIQLTERDAPNYNEMMAHVPLMEFGLASKSLPKRVLVIGGGDGYVVAEVLKHSSVVQVDHVELDQGVIDVSARHFPWATVSDADGSTHSLWDDKRVNLHVQDAAEFVRKAPSGFYDVIVQDSSDPEVVEEDGSVTVLPGSVLFTDDHFGHLNRVLSSEGIFAFQAETYNIPSSLKSIRTWRASLQQTGFATVQYATIAIPTYSTGQIGMYVCNKQNMTPESSSNNDAVTEKQAWIKERFDKLSGDTLYYHPRLQTRYV